jgi:hypothetical protein
MYTGLIFMGVVIVSIFCWGLTIERVFHPEKIDKVDSHIMLLLIFWPIGLPILLIFGLKHLFKLAISKEEK